MAEKLMIPEVESAMSGSLFLHTPTKQLWHRSDDETAWTIVREREACKGLWEHILGIRILIMQRFGPITAADFSFGNSRKVIYDVTGLWLVDGRHVITGGNIVWILVYFCNLCILEDVNQNKLQSIHTDTTHRRCYISTKRVKFFYIP